MVEDCRPSTFQRFSRCLKTSLASPYAYPYEEFVDHIKAMRTVREWEYTSRFGHLGNAQTSRANSARVLEYFSDCYDAQKEAVYKAGLFLSIYDYVGRHAGLFSRKRLLEDVDGSLFSVDPCLLRAVHFVFTSVAQSADIDPKKVVILARALKAIAPAS
jgi:hypothetical protein